jgi:hypothetical protein
MEEPQGSIKEEVAKAHAPPTSIIALCKGDAEGDEDGMPPTVRCSCEQPE